MNIMYIIAIVKHPVAVSLYAVLCPIAFINKPPPKVPALRPIKNSLKRSELIYSENNGVLTVNIPFLLRIFYLYLFFVLKLFVIV